MPMRRRTNAKGDPNRNLQLRDGEVQFEPAGRYPDGGPAHFSSAGMSAYAPGPDSDPFFRRGFGMVQLSINVRGSGGGSGWVWLTKDELSEWVEYLTEVRDSLPDVPPPE